MANLPSLSLSLSLSLLHLCSLYFSILGSSLFLFFSLHIDFSLQHVVASYYVLQRILIKRQITALYPLQSTFINFTRKENARIVEDEEKV